MCARRVHTPANNNGDECIGEFVEYDASKTPRYNFDAQFSLDCYILEINGNATINLEVVQDFFASVI